MLRSKLKVGVALRIFESDRKLLSPTVVYHVHHPMVSSIGPCDRDPAHTPGLDR